MSRISWFPGHMRKAMRLIEEKLKLADAVIEVRDARIPISSINPTFNDLVEKYKRPKLIVINKADLIDVQDRAWVKQHICKTEITSHRASLKLKVILAISNSKMVSESRWAASTVMTKMVNFQYEYVSKI